jgi:Ca2+-binding RTX toxin-like protein
VNLAGASATVTGTVTSAAGADDVAITARTTDKLSISMGAGNDTVRISNIAAIHTIAGGDGTDTLVTSAAISSTTGANISGFESVSLGAVAVALSTTTNTINAVTFTGDGGSLTGVAAGGTITQAAGGTNTVANAGWTGATDALTVNVGASTVGGAITQSLTTTLLETVTINNLTLSSDITSARSVGATGAALSTLNVTSTNTAPVTVTGGSAVLATVDASGILGNASITALTTLPAGSRITAGAGNDTITNTTGAVTVSGGAGNDTITTGTGADSIDGGAGNDTITASSGNNTVTGGDGNDNITTTTGADSIDGGAGNDTITGGVGSDTLTGGAGTDVFIYAANATGAMESSSTITDTITDFVSGTDKIQLPAGSNVSFVGNVANMQLGLSAMTAANQSFFVTSENSLYVVSTFANNAGSLTANDIIIKLTGVTSLAPADLLLGTQSTGNTVAIPTGATAINVGVGTSSTTGTTYTSSASVATTAGGTSINNDIVTINSTQAAAAPTIAGGAGNDVLTVSVTASATSAFSVDLTNVTSIETVNLPNHVAAITTTLVANNVTTGNSLKIDGSASLGVDSSGATLANALTISAANIIISTATVELIGGAGNDTLTGGAGNDTLTGGAGLDSLTGGALNDVLSGGDGDDTLAGGTGNDSMTGGAGNDTFQAVELADTVDGGAGVDSVTIESGTLTGTLIGGDGNDTITLTGSTATVWTAANVTGFENVVLPGAISLTYPSAAALAITAGAGATTIASGVGTSTYTITQANANTLTVSGTGSFVVAANSTNLGSAATVITSTQSAGTLAVTPGLTTTAITTGAANLTVSASIYTGPGLTLVNGAGTIGVTGLGTTTGDVLTLGAGTGATTIATAGAFANTITEGAGSQAVIINKAGTGDITLTTTSTIASTTINDTGATGNVTASGPGAINYTATVGLHSVTGGSGNDTITGFTGNDTIIGGAGADRIITGGGTDRIIMAAADSGVVAGLVAGAASWANGTVLGTSGLDTIEGFVVSSGVTPSIQFSDITTTSTILRNGATLGASTTGNTNLLHITGIYDRTANTFTTSLAGTSTLMVYDDNGTTAGGDFRAVVLVGYIDGAGNDTAGTSSGLQGIA